MANNKGNAENSLLSSDFYDFAGIDHITSPFLIKENNLIQCINFISTGIVGGKKTREPYATFLNAPDSSEVRNLIYFVYTNSDNSTTGYLIRISGAHFYYYEFGGVPTTWTADTNFTCTNTTTPFAFAILGNMLHLSNGTDAYQTWTPSGSFISDSSAPKFRTMTPYQRRVFGSNVPGDTSALYWSSVDYVGAPSETSTLAANVSSGTSITVNDSQFGGSGFGLPASSLNYAVQIGIGTANEEDNFVTAVSGTSAPYTLTLKNSITKSHSIGDTVANNAPWYNDANNPSTSTYIPIDTGYNGDVIALDEVNNNLNIHKSLGAVYLYNGTSVSNPLQYNNPFFNAPGQACVSPYSIDQINGAELYLNRDGIYINQSGAPQILSYQVHDFIENMAGSQYAVAPGVGFNKKYYLSIGDVTDNYGNTINNCILAYDYVLNLWETHSFASTPTAWAVGVDNSGNQQLYFGDGSGNTYIYNSGTGNASAPATAMLQTPYLTWGAPDKSKSWDSYTLNTNPGANFQLQASVDWSNEWTQITNVSGFGVSDRAPGTMKNFKSIAFRIVSNTTIPMTFYGLTLRINIGTRRFSGRRI